MPRVYFMCSEAWSTTVPTCESGCTPPFFLSCSGARFTAWSARGRVCRRQGIRGRRGGFRGGLSGQGGVAYSWSSFCRRSLEILLCSRAATASSCSGALPSRASRIESISRADLPVAHTM